MTAISDIGFECVIVFPAPDTDEDRAAIIWCDCARLGFESAPFIADLIDMHSSIHGSMPSEDRDQIASIGGGRDRNFNRFNRSIAFRLNGRSAGTAKRKCHNGCQSPHAAERSAQSRGVNVGFRHRLMVA